MTNKQDANSKVGAEPSESPKDVAQNEISSTPQKDTLGDSALNDVSGGLWPYVTSSNTYNKAI